MDVIFYITLGINFSLLAYIIIKITAFFIGKTFENFKIISFFFKSYSYVVFILALKSSLYKSSDSMVLGIINVIMTLSLCKKKYSFHLFFICSFLLVPAFISSFLSFLLGIIPLRLFLEF